MAGFGATNTAVIGCGGRPPNSNGSTEYWNGSSWTEVNDMNSGRFAMNISGAGHSHIRLVSGGYPGPNDAVEIWDGTNWTAAGSELNIARSQGSSSGQSSSSASAVGGYYTAAIANTEQWNGSTWTEKGDLNTARYSNALSGDSNSLLTNGGEPPGGITTKTEAFDGTSWSEVADLSVARKDHGTSGYSSSISSSFSFAGKAPSTNFKDSSEVWETTFTPTTLKKITEGQLYFNSTANAFKETITDIPGASWSSGGSLNTARGYNAASGLQTAALLVVVQKTQNLDQQHSLNHMMEVLGRKRVI